ncbi:ABC transporter substrate-binding protein [Williamsia sp. 1138]|uniref:ABC transporter substrate-binding protein n=1 Tax=Williamsia sp. 1138 TaxID=1903117 RepID=UPI000A10BAB4|nr:ABC transporter substrate-binding protein [Williamsia sp. 1138]OZG25748.1 ABC transporter substrate-binding protein [Williamsia sp. 1138]
MKSQNRTFSTVARLAVLATALLLPVACSSDDGESSSGGDAAITVTGAFGDAVVEQTPERVVALSTTDADFLLSVDVTPVAIPKATATDPTTGGTGIYPWEEGRYPADTPTLATPTKDISLESVAALDPDLIVATGFYGLDQQTYDSLSSIAPVVHFDSKPNADAWQDSVRKVGQVLDRTDEAETSIKTADGVIASARTDNPALAGKSYNAIISPSAEGMFVLCSQDDNMARVMKDLGLELSAYAQTVDCDNGKGKVAWENVSALEADLLWVVPDNAEQVQVLDSQALWNQLPAVERGAVATVPKTDGVPFALAFPSPISLEWGVGQLVPQLAAAAGK